MYYTKNFNDDLNDHSNLVNNLSSSKTSNHNHHQLLKVVEVVEVELVVYTHAYVNISNKN